MKRSVAALILFGCLGVCASSAWGDCVPVVYAFRHAEDTDSFTLTPTGIAHRDLYVKMVSDFEAITLQPSNRKPCPVTKVYAATTEDKPNFEKSATNAFHTATALATDRMGSAPIITVANRKLYEYVSNDTNAPADPTKPELYTGTTATALRTALLATANLGQSSAIFWTSQGLQVLGGAIIKGFSRVPGKVKGDWTLPPRNAVYLFTARDSAPNITQFEDTPMTPETPSHPASVSSTVYVQCFNWFGPSTQPPVGERDENSFIKRSASTQIYYCGFGVHSSPGGKPPDGCDVNNPDPLAKPCGLIPNGRTKDLRGKICDTRTLLADSHGTQIFGACEGPAE
jgi:hypothetical protein